MTPISPKKKRCPNGTRKNKKTGICEKKKEKEEKGKKEEIQRNKSMALPKKTTPERMLLQFHSKSALLKNGDKLPPTALRDLSNFAYFSVEYDGHKYPTIEHAFQAQKYTCTSKPELVSRFHDGTYDTPEKAKTAGGKGAMKKAGVTLDIDCWNGKKDALMEELVKSKTKHPEIQKILKIAQSENIRFVHFSRFDMEWGAHMKDGKIVEGKNKLGEIYNRIIDR